VTSPFSGQVVVITGAGSGIGRAIALAFAGHSTRLHLTDLREDRLQAVQKEVTERGSTATIHIVDSRQAHQLEALAAQVFAQENRVDILCNNAGVGHSGMAQDMPLETWREIIETNLLGPVHGVVAFLPRMLAQEGSAHIVNIASVAGLVGVPGLAAYCASKFGVVGLTEALAVEISSKKVQMHVICPGVINTNIVNDSRMGPLGKIDKEAIQQFYKAYGAEADQVAVDVFRALSGGKVLQLSAPGPYRFLWWLKRLWIRAYFWAGRWMGQVTIERGLPGGRRRA
jgi:NAD(P)-dependent dehydrogenase (short-subunit alcohol dehydrogenase family)